MSSKWKSELKPGYTGKAQSTVFRAVKQTFLKRSQHGLRKLEVEARIRQAEREHAKAVGYERVQDELLERRRKRAE